MKITRIQLKNGFARIVYTETKYVRVRVKRNHHPSGGDMWEVEYGKSSSDFVTGYGFGENGRREAFAEARAEMEKTEKIKELIQQSLKLKTPLMIWSSDLGLSDMFRFCFEGEFVTLCANMYYGMDEVMIDLPKVIRSEGRGILFIEGLPQAAPSVQKAIGELVVNRKVGSCRLGKDWTIIACGKNDGELPSFVSSRMTHTHLGEQS